LLLSKPETKPLANTSGRSSQAEPNNETAWLWLASLAETEQRRQYLERVLAINPAAS
jgi:hypothetical protein